MAHKRTLRKNVTYHPPTTSDIHAFTRKVCEELGETLDSGFDTPEVHQELAGFIKVIASICAKQLNKGAEKIIDSENQAE